MQGDHWKQCGVCSLAVITRLAGQSADRAQFGRSKCHDRGCVRFAGPQHFLFCLNTTFVVVLRSVKDINVGKPGVNCEKIIKFNLIHAEFDQLRCL